jgi:hypothetical protein
MLTDLPARGWRVPRCLRRLPPAEGDVGDPAGAGHGLNPEAVFERLQPIPQPLPAAQHDGHHDDVQVVDQAGGQELADSGRAAADADVAASGGLALWVPKTCVTWADALQIAVGSVQRSGAGRAGLGLSGAAMIYDLWA